LDTRGGAQAIDQCSPQEQLIWTNSFTVAPTGCDSEIVTFTVTDGCGRSVSTVATFTIVDTTRPVFSPPPQDRETQCDPANNQASYSQWVATHGGASVIDECAITITWSNNATAAVPTGCGRRVVLFSAQDNCNNVVFATASYRIIDNEGPSFITFAQNTTVECSPLENVNQLNAFISSRGGAIAFDACYGDNIIWSNTFSGTLTTGRCTQFSTVTFRAADPCGAASSTTATFTIRDSTPPELLVPASPASFECNDLLNGSQIEEYLAIRGGAAATDSCTVVTWTDDFIAPPVECAPALTVVFTAADICGNVRQTFGSIEIIDSVRPSFIDFPLDLTIGCDRGTEPEQTGFPTVSDTCDDEPLLTYSDIQITLPDKLFCPGDVITYRTWVVMDNCGNRNEC
jgi:hypothetical protein